MTDIIKIGSKEVGMTANGASPYIFKQIFKRDFLKESMKTAEAGEMDIDLVVCMGFVMAVQYQQGTTAALKKTQDDFAAWLENFGLFDVQLAAGQIADLWGLSSGTTSNPKKEAG